MSPETPASLLDKLRGVGFPRPKVDPELAGGLREWLEDSVSGHVAQLGVRGRVQLSRVQLSSLVPDATANSQPASTWSSHRVGSTDPVCLRAMVRCLFRQWTTTGRIDDPIEDAISGESASGDPEGAVELVSRMSGEERRLLADVVRAHADQITATWPALSPAWYPRSHERLTVPLCGGTVVLAGIADLVVGPQASSEASVCIVEVQTERRRVEHRVDLHFLALLETLRAGAAPSRVATYYTGTGELDAQPVDEPLLVRALLRTIAGVERLCSRQAERTPGWDPSSVTTAPVGAAR